MSRRLKRWACAAFLLALTTPLAVAQEQEKVGERPYEMVWANRTEEVRDPIVDFESLDGWTVETENSEATFERSRRTDVRNVRRQIDVSRETRRVVSLRRHHASSEADRRSRRRRFLLLLDLRKQLDVGQPSGDAARQRLCAPARFEGERV